VVSRHRQQFCSHPNDIAITLLDSKDLQDILYHNRFFPSQRKGYIDHVFRAR